MLLMHDDNDGDEDNDGEDEDNDGRFTALITIDLLFPSHLR